MKNRWVRFWPSDWLAGTRGMSAVDTGIYITLIATMYERERPLTDDNASLARLCGTSNSTLKRSLEMLIKSGKIILTENGLWNEKVGRELSVSHEKSGVNARSANARWSKKDNKNNDPPMRSQCVRNANIESEPEIEDSLNLYIAQKPISNRKKISDIDAEFEENFWPIYPRKIGKGQALKAYRAARKSTDMQTIIDGVRRYAKSREGKEPEFTRYASTWLNGLCWEDVTPEDEATVESRKYLEQLIKQENMGNGRASDSELETEDQGNDFRHWH